MKLIFKSLFVLAILLVIFLIGGMMLPEKLHLERSVVIHKKADSVYPFVSDFRLYNLWSPWAKIDSDTVYKYEGPARGKGSIMHWSSEHPQVGKGSQKILEEIPGQYLKNVLVFSGMGKAHSHFKLNEEQDATTLTWGFEMHFGYNIPGRVFGLWMADEVAEAYDQGLLSIKQLAEAKN